MERPRKKPTAALPKCGRPIHTALSQDEVERLLAATDVAEQRRTFLLAAYAGLRAGEVRALRWKDVDFRTRTLTVRLSSHRGEISTPKSALERWAPLAEALLTELSTTPRKERDPEALVCMTSKGEAWGQDGILQSFRRACARVGLKGWRYHDLRHFFVTSLLRTGAPAPPALTTRRPPVSANAPRRRGLLPYEFSEDALCSLREVFNERRQD